MPQSSRYIELKGHLLVCVELARISGSFFLGLERIIKSLYSILLFGRDEISVLMRMLDAAHLFEPQEG
jgi:hypothetical protein